jgi:hypothetical protein
MDEYIKREALITKFKKMELGEHGLVERLFADGVYAVIAAFPAADAQGIKERIAMDIERYGDCKVVSIVSDRGREEQLRMKGAKL